MLPIFFDNPVLTREMRRRMRGKAMIYSLITYVATLCVVTFLILVIMGGHLHGQRDSLDLVGKMQNVGDLIFTGMVVVQAILVLVLAPAITASMITAEREKGTADFLRVTTLPPSHFIAGAFLSTILYVILLLGCALPVASITLLFGGRSPLEILLAFGALLVGSVVLSSLGIYTSSTREKTRSAQATMMGMAFLFFIVGLNYRNLVGGIQNMFGLQSAAVFGQGTYALFNVPVPDWLFVGVVPLMFSLIILVAAGRKVYTPQKRPLNYTQFTVWALLLFVIIIGLFWGVPGKLTSALNLWFTASVFMFAVGVLTLTVYPLEVGSERWRIHERAPFLAVVDDGIVYLLLLSGGWWLLGNWFFGGSEVHQRVFQIMATALVPPFIFLAVLGRLLAHRFNKPNWPFRVVALLMGLVWVLLPLVIVLSLGLRLNGGSNETLVHFSPFFSQVVIADLDLAKKSSVMLPQAFSLEWPGHFQSVCYGFLAVLLYLRLLGKNYVARRELEELTENCNDAPVGDDAGAPPLAAV
ncbi:ABC transporter permease [Candidatus Sumerlaeota bacterium]